jgi:hypothetical protein
MPSKDEPPPSSSGMGIGDLRPVFRLLESFSVPSNHSDLQVEARSFNPKLSLSTGLGDFDRLCEYLNWEVHIRERNKYVYHHLIIHR